MEQCINMIKMNYYLNHTKIPKNTLWQYLEKKHLDPKGELTKKQWIEFVDECKYSFCDEVSQIGQEYLAQWREEHD